MGAKAKEPNPAGVDAWLAKLPADQREALQRLREAIRVAAPDATETIAYNVPMYYAGTTPLLGFNAFKHHLSFGVGSKTIAAVGAALDGYDTMKDTIRFTPASQLPATLVKKIVRARIALHVAEAT